MDFDQKYCLKCLQDLIETPSPVSYYEEVNPVVAKYAQELGFKVTYDKKHTVYLTMEGQDSSKTVMIGAHLDTLGLMVRKIEDNGTLRVRNLGGVSFASIDNETVTVHTREGKKYTGLCVCDSHSTHVFTDARTKIRDEDCMMISLDERVSTKEDVLKMGIQNGDIISFDPRFQTTKNGYVKTRFIDDKAAVAVCFAVIKAMVANGVKPAYRTIFAFPHFEEINHGGAYIPPEVDEFVAIDIGLIGPGLNGNERSVSICAKDNFTPYDRELTTKLIHLAQQEKLAYAVDVFFHYGTDASAAWRAGNNVVAAAFGMACWCSHGMERTHVDGLLQTEKLLFAYLTSK